MAGVDGRKVEGTCRDARCVPVGKAQCECTLEMNGDLVLFMTRIFALVKASAAEARWLENRMNADLRMGRDHNVLDSKIVMILQGAG